MITLNSRKFAETESEMINSLFEDSTCVGYAKGNKRTVTLMDHNHNKIGVINNHGLLCSATRQKNNRYWYSFATISLVGEYPNYAQSIEEPKNVLAALIKQ